MILCGFIMMRNSLTHKTRFFLTVSLIVWMTALSGCKNRMDVKRGNLTQEQEYTKAFFVGDVAVPYGADPIEITTVSLAANLAGTGSDPPESVHRTMLLREMASQNVLHPSKILADPSTSLVVVTGYLPPGVQKGDHFDVEVTLPPDSETTSLRGGFLMPAPMRDLYYSKGVHEGHTQGSCTGPILVEPKTGTERDRTTQCRGMVLGGGVSTTSRPVELRVRMETNKPDKFLTMKIESSINRRFQIVASDGGKIKAAAAKTDKYLVLNIPPKYKQNIYRFVNVIRCMPIVETEAQRFNRLKTLEKRLLEPTTAKRASLELEAIGKNAIDTLKMGLASDNEFVQFQSAQALAYLDVSEAAPVLGKTALNDRVNRGYALLALCALNDLYAYEELRQLMNAPTAETRYGAFRAITVMRPNDPLVAGEKLGNKTFTLCVVPTTGSPMLHVSKTNRAEIVLFGENQTFKYPMTIEAANNIIVRANSPTEFVVSRFEPNKPDQKRVISGRVEEVIHALSDVGATYPDVLEVLQSAIEQNALDASFRIDAIPTTDRFNPYDTTFKKEESKSKKAKKSASATGSAAVAASAESADDSGTDSDSENDSDSLHDYSADRSADFDPAALSDEETSSVPVPLPEE